MHARKLGYVDIGARGGASAEFARLRDRFDLVLVEPEPAEFQRLQRDSAAGTRVIGAALGHIDAMIDFHETVNPNCSSALQVNQDFLANYGIRPHFTPKSRTTMACRRYDTLFAAGGLPLPHAVKVDVQGFEFQVLSGFGALLHQCLSIQAETHFYPLYRDQRIFGDLVAFLADFGFVLRRLGNPRSPELNGDPHFEGDLVEVDAVFTKSKHWLTTQPDHARADFAIACEVFGVPAYR